MSTLELSPDELTELLSGLTPEIPGYRVMRLIGRGGMSFVYLGLQESLDRQVAIKVIAPHALKDEVSKARFEKEARTIAKLQHPCIVGIHAVGRTDEGLLYYVLPYLAKGHLGLRDLTRDDAAVVEVVRAMLWALDYAHAHGVVHRDVKAENVLFDNADRPLLADFGIAANKRIGMRMTGDGLAVGSSAHMAPEQARAEHVDGRADLYSLGVLTFEMVCGRLPFENQDALGLAVMHAVDPVPRLTPEKRHWQAFIDTAMAKRADDRFANAREMMAALERVVDQIKREPDAAPAPVARRRRAVPAGSPSRNSKVARAIVGAAALAAVIALGWFALPTRDVANPLAGVTTRIASEYDPATTSALSDEAGATQAATDTDLDTDAPAEPVTVELAPGELELAAAAQQIVRRRLTQPPNDNAFDSLRAAHRIAPQAPALARTGQQWLKAATPYVASGLADGKDDAARGLFDRATTLADELQLQENPAWTELQAVVTDAMTTRLRAALARNDVALLRQAKAAATQWGIAPARLEPFWSQPIVRARVGDVLRSGATAMVLTRMPTAARPGLAVAPTAVTRADYAAFVAATRRASARCRIRTATMTLKRRTWERPGFAQASGHPVVCVSAADATAYAAWRGQRDARRYRLPQAAEWRALGTANATPACRGRCKGTAPIGTGTAIRSHAGNAREWSVDCRDGCTRRVSVGTSWRDANASQGKRGVDLVESEAGYDDIGFRLVREVSAAELDAR
jgi:serine/threonine-protein kinase PpkA